MGGKYRSTSFALAAGGFAAEQTPVESADSGPAAAPRRAAAMVLDAQPLISINVAAQDTWARWPDASIQRRRRAGHDIGVSLGRTPADEDSLAGIILPASRRS